MLLRVKEITTGERFRDVRERSLRLAAGLTAEDLQLQSMPDASPGKWHLAHTTWFFETFVLADFAPSYRPKHPEYRNLFNSYYDAVGDRHPRPERGLLSRPGLEEVLDYRRRVEEALRPLLDGEDARLQSLLELGIHHEEQHQELFLTDLKHAFSRNSQRPAMRPIALPPAATAAPLAWHSFAAGPGQIGAGEDGFAFDNERPRHPVFVSDFQIASRALSNGEVLDFVEAGGYARPEFWLSDGFAIAQREGWRSPLYWRQVDGEWLEFTLHGEQPLDRNAPATHLSLYEADACAAFYGARLPREEEWELACQSLLEASDDALSGRFQDGELFHPGGGAAWLGDVWEWTASAYAAYPGYRRPSGAVGEYNGKFMNGQYVLRGASCATPERHVRATYRDFFYAGQRWQFSGLRLARDVQ
ncbi:MAG: ergothioneine biosynthesis protein EgtB [Leptospirales bacterium]|nr:ergothioneine biosynthesis protein EgtB [Leptospirales bacterium]